MLGPLSVHHEISKAHFVVWHLFLSIHSVHRLLLLLHVFDVFFSELGYGLFSNHYHLSLVLSCHLGCQVCSLISFSHKCWVLLIRVVVGIHGTHGTLRCQIVTVPTILEILHDGTTVDYYTNGASFRSTAAASTLFPASHRLLIPCKQTHTATTATELHSC